MTGSLLLRPSLSPEQRRLMLEILDQNFVHITPESFTRDLDEKNWVILLHDDLGHLVGFSTLLYYQTTFNGTPLAVLYSGDTIVQRHAWGSPALARTWIHSVWQLHAAHAPQLPLYWLLLTSGFRTYRFLSVFLKTFHPSCHAPMPPEVLGLRDHLARARFGTRYDLAAGVVHLGQPLRDDLLEIPDARLIDPHIAYFARHNPGYVHGDELVCLAHLSPDNLTPAGRRMAAAAPHLHAPQEA